MRRLLFAGLALAMATAAGCGGKKNTSVTDQGATLAPKSSAAVVGTVLQFIPVTEVIVTDIDDICGKFSGINACNPGASSPTSAVSSGTILAVEIITNATGDYQVGDPSHPPTDGGGGLFGVTAVVEFEQVVNGVVKVSDVANSGVVHLTDVSVGGSAAGSYDVTMNSGAHLAGDFTGDNCAGLAALLTSTTSNSCTSGNFSSTTCSESCSCGGQTVGASCSQFPDAGAWTCTCTDKTGASSQCTMPSSTFSDQACGQGESCCPLSF